jgi:hypothetical protein
MANNLFRKDIKIEKLSENFSERMYQVFGLPDNYIIGRENGNCIEISVSPKDMGILIGKGGCNIKELSKFFNNKKCKALYPIIISPLWEGENEANIKINRKMNQFVMHTVIYVNKEIFKKGRHISAFGNEFQWISEWEAKEFGIPNELIEKYKKEIK